MGLLGLLADVAGAGTMIAPVFDRDGIMVYQGDARDVVPQLGAGSVDLVLTDPPYSPRTHAGARTGNLGTRALTRYDAIEVADLALVWRELGRVAARWVVATLDHSHLAWLMFEPPTPALAFVRFGVWVKDRSAPQFSGDRPASCVETIGIWHRADRPCRWAGGGGPALWTAAPVRVSRWPGEKPIGLVVALLEAFSDPGGVVLDPFCGSGTVLEACRLTGRRAIGIDADAAAVALTLERLRQTVLPLPARAPEPWAVPLIDLGDGEA